MVEALTILGIFILGVYVGWKIHETLIVQAIKHQPEGLEEAIKIAKANREQGDQEVELTTKDGETVKTKGVELEIEHVGGHFYAYAKINNQFIAQGETLEKLLETAHKRFPGKVFFGDLPEEEHQKS